jgi:hypothetical protein
VTCTLSFIPSANGYFATVVYKNGTTNANQLGVGQIDLTATPIAASPDYTSVVQLAAGDVLTCAGAQNSSANQPLQGGFIGRNVFSVTRLY